MAESAASGTKDETEKPVEAEAGSYPSLSLKIWPPTQRTREAVVHRLVETLTSHSVLPRSYGLLPGEESSVVARAIEEEAFSVASAAPTSDDDDDDGMKVLRIYSHEISRRVVASAKERAADDDAAAAAASAPQC